MQLPFQNFTTAVGNMVTAAQGACAQLLDLTVGSVLRAAFESYGALAMWLQYLILLVLSVTRAATSAGSDLDTWMADFGLTRITGVPASGNVTFARNVATASVLIPVGTQVATADLSVSFAVVESDSNPLWTPSQGGYVIPAGTASANLPVIAATVGTSGNVAAGAISFLQAALAIDSVTNAAAFTTGLNAETDAAFRLRFVAYLASLVRGTAPAIGFAVTSTPGVVSYTLTQNYDTNGAWDPGSIVVVVDDGTGSPSATLISSVAANVLAYVAAGIRYGVIGPQLILANVSLILSTPAGVTHATVVATATAAIASYITSLPVGASLSYLRLAQVAFDSAPGQITNVSTYTLNGGASDIIASAYQVIRPGTLSII